VSAGAANERPRGGVRVLEDRVINQIAAGEVVERPASVVKELVENALDAGARHLRVTLRGGGRDLVQVEDDGEGMSRQDAMLCVERHATSKIRDADDLAAVRTLGFRGEALPSIAAVSRFELLTRVPTEDVGTRVVIDAGRMVDVRDAGCPPGTRITVRNLFANLPARRKFLRTVPTELSHCQDAVFRETLMRQGLGVELFHEGRALVRLPAGGGPVERARALLGRTAERLVEVGWSGDVAGGFSVQGLASPPGVHHPSARGSLWLYVNGRAVRDPLMRRAVLDAFRGLVPKGRYPTVILDLRMPPEEVDVNVHPAKTEVRFRDGRDVARALSEGLRGALAERGIQSPAVLRPARGARPPRRDVSVDQVVLPGVDTRPVPHGIEGESDSAAGGAATPDAGALRARVDRGAHLHLAAERGGEWRPAAPSPDLPPAPPPPTDAHGDAVDRPPLPPAPVGSRRPAAPRLVGQLAERWLLCEVDGGLLLIDQHRAHARLLCHRLAASPDPVPLLAPVMVEADPADVRAIEGAATTLASFGVELEGFGGDTLRLRALPAVCASADPEALVRALAAAIRGGADADRLRELLARHGAIPAGRSLSPYEQRSLLGDIDPFASGVSTLIDADELRRRTGGDP